MRFYKGGTMDAPGPEGLPVDRHVYETEAELLAQLDEAVAQWVGEAEVAPDDIALLTGTQRRAKRALEGRRARRHPPDRRPMGAEPDPPLLDLPLQGARADGGRPVRARRGTRAGALRGALAAKRVSFALRAYYIEEAPDVSWPRPNPLRDHILDTFILGPSTNLQLWRLVCRERLLGDRGRSQPKHLVKRRRDQSPSFEGKIFKALGLPQVLIQRHPLRLELRLRRILQVLRWVSVADLDVVVL